jgi:hypothetical protein
MTGYELSYQMGIKIDRVKEPFALPAKSTEIASPAGGVNGTAPRPMRWRRMRTGACAPSTGC